MTQNLNSPAIEQGPITAADLDAHLSDKTCCAGDCNQGRTCPFRWPAAAATEIGFEREGQHCETWITRAWLRVARALG